MTHMPASLRTHTVYSPVMETELFLHFIHIILFALEMSDVGCRSLVVVESFHSSCSLVSSKILEATLRCMIVAVAADLTNFDVPLSIQQAH